MSCLQLNKTIPLRGHLHRPQLQQACGRAEDAPPEEPGGLLEALLERRGPWLRGRETARHGEDGFQGEALV